MKEENVHITFERDPKTGRLTKLSLPSDLPVEQRTTLLVPLIDSLVISMEKLDASNRKYSKILQNLTITLIVLTVVLVGLGIAQMAF